MNDSQTPAAAICLTTVGTVANRNVEAEIEIVSSQCVLGINVWQDTGGGRSEAMAKIMKQGRETALQELRREAFAVGADAVIGVHLTCTVTSNQGLSALLVVATGTAVLLSAQSASAR